MKEVNNPNKTYTVELTHKEVEFIREMTQNPLSDDDFASDIRLSLFVGSMRLLGYTMNDDGTIFRKGI